MKKGEAAAYKEFRAPGALFVSGGNFCFKE